MQTVEDYLNAFRRTNWETPMLEKVCAQYPAGSPGNLAAVKLLAERREARDQARSQNEEARHDETMVVAIAAKMLAERQVESERVERRREEARHAEAMETAQAANRLARRAIIVAILALGVAIVQTYRR